MLNLNDTGDVKEVYFYTYAKAAIDAKGRIALAQVVFTDGSYFCMIYHTFPDGTTRWRPAYITLQQESEDLVPMVGGPLMDKLAGIACKTQAFLKATVGQVQFGSTYRVTRDKAELVTNLPAGQLYQ